MVGWMDEFTDAHAKKPQGPQDPGDPEARGGFGGLSYTPQDIFNIPGMPQNLKNADTFGNIASTIMAGSRNAQGALMNMYHELYRTRAEGLSSAQGAFGESVQGETQAQGLSPDIARQMLRTNDASVTAQKGQALGEAKAGYYGDLADLEKGTSTELAGLGLNEITMIMQAYLASKARAAGNKAGTLGAIGTLGGVALTAATGGGIGFGGGGGGGSGGPSWSH